MFTRLQSDCRHYIIVSTSPSICFYFRWQVDIECKANKPVKANAKHSVGPQSGDEEIAVLPSAAEIRQGPVVERDHTHTTPVPILETVRRAGTRCVDKRESGSVQRLVLANYCSQSKRLDYSLRGDFEFCLKFKGYACCCALAVKVLVFHNRQTPSKVVHVIRNFLKRVNEPFSQIIIS